MKLLLVIVGAILLVVAVVCPMPSLLGISWIVWRVIISALGGLMLITGIYMTSKNKISKE